MNHEAGWQQLPSDAQARITALDPSRSFIVQAPAGSGKTELLIQRMLSLLAGAQHPSEVLAITFTRKAAGEMRERLLTALASARSDAEPAHSPARERWRLARQVIARDEALSWKLTERPALLAIDTFDAFSLRITQLAPLAEQGARIGLASLEEDASALHLDAARRAVLDAEELRHVEAISMLLDALDNRVSAIVKLLAELLGKRAQWMDRLVDDSDEAIANMRAVLVSMIESEITQLHALWPQSLSETTTALAAYAADSATDAAKQAYWHTLAAADLWGCTISSLNQWSALSVFLLTGDGTWRKQFNVRDGFATPGDSGLTREEKAERAAAKQSVLQLVEAVQNFSQSETLRHRLSSVRGLPNLAAIEAHEPVLRAALYLLKVAAAELSLIERERAVTDFSGIAMAAKHALYEYRDEVFSRLEARIQHILVDEFQDTNPAQASLIETLVADWNEGDGHTLFLVGDPMQSIYGFRDADVGIFTDAWVHGIANVKLNPLVVSANYRSRPELVAWVNHSFATIFERSALAAVSGKSSVQFASAAATRNSVNLAPGLPSPSTPRTHVHANADDEAGAITDEIAQLLRTDPQQRIAILVRAKNHATDIVRHLQAKHIGFIARDMAQWSERPLIRDVLSLTYVLAQPGDELSVYAWLRSPMVGLTLTSFAQLSQWQHAHQLDALNALRAPEFIATLEEGEQKRVRGALDALDIAEDQINLGTLADRVHAVFRACGGDDIAATDDLDAELADYLSFLDEQMIDAMLPPRKMFEASMARRFLSFASKSAHSVTENPNSVEILTIHKAKGLEWDTVFLPQLDRAPPPDSRGLVVWDFVRTHEAATAGLRFGSQKAPTQLLVAAKETRRRSDESVFQFVHDRRVAARAEEAKRLIYVAVTRAREQLILSGSSTQAGEQPSVRSLAALIDWPSSEATKTAGEVAPVSQRLIMRRSLTRRVNEFNIDSNTGLPHDVQSAKNPAVRRSFAATERQQYPIEDEFKVTINPQRGDDIAFGIVGHKLLEGLAMWRERSRVRAHVHAYAHVAAQSMSDGFRPERLQIIRALVDAGARDTEAPTLAAMLEQTLQRLASSAPIEFLFDPSHQSAANELNLTVFNDTPLEINQREVPDAHQLSKFSNASKKSKLTLMRVDRTFISAAGERWVVDYKFSAPATAPATDPTAAARDESALTQWLDGQCATHRTQLTTYADALKRIEPSRTVVMAIYFPMLDRLQII